MPSGAVRSARRAHNPEAVGSNPTLAISFLVEFKPTPWHSQNPQVDFSVVCSSTNFQMFFCLQKNTPSKSSKFATVSNLDNFFGWLDLNQL
jgi:hypothetical protein